MALSAILSLTFMRIQIIISIISTIVWLIPPFRQYGTRFFYYFLFLGLADLVRPLLFFVFKANPILVFPFFVFLLLASLVKNKKLKITLTILSLVSIIVISHFQIHSMAVNAFTCFLHLMIVFVFVSLLVDHLNETRSINLFLSLLIVYEFNTVLKYIFILTGNAQGIVSYFLATFTQIFLGIIFSFITFNTKNFQILAKE